ncbi:hypothetical protein H0H93_004000 [Arthromyces matolae]|nr:hypothetical protein H0H93_004000 [Arthromyces matolae]
MPLSSNPNIRRPFPTELLHYVLVQLIAHSVHAICVSPENVDWEMNIFPTLCSVSYNFRAVAVDIMKQAFPSSATPSDSDVSRPSRKTSHFVPEDNDGLLIFGYSLLLSALDLRINSIRAPSIEFQVAQEISISALSLSLTMCPKIEPVGLADVLSDAMREQMEFMKSGLKIVRSAASLNTLADAWGGREHDSELESVSQRAEHLDKFSKQIDELEKAYEVYAEIIESDSLFKTSPLPGVLAVLSKLQALETDDLERIFASRMESLIQRWSAFLTEPSS